MMDAREIGQAATLMYTLTNANITRICYRDHAAADAQLSKAVALADEKGAALWKAYGMVLRGCVLTLTGKASDAIQTLSPSIVAANCRLKPYRECSVEGAQHVVGGGIPRVRRGMSWLG